MSASETRTVDSNPWRDLRHYQEEDAHLFFGRDEEVDHLDRLIQGETLAVLYGVSGLGKTSLLLAGLFPRLRARRCFPVRWRIGLANTAVSLTWQFLEAVQKAAQEGGYEVPEPIPGESLWQYFHRRGARIWDSSVRPQTPVLVLDQFEEVFVKHRWMAGAGQTALDTFLSELGNLVENQPTPADLEPPAGAVDTRGEPPQYDRERVSLHVVLSIREDFLAPLASLRRFFPTLRRAEFRLLRFGRLQAVEVIEGGSDKVLERFTTKDARKAALEEVGAKDDGPSGAVEGAPETFNPTILSLFLHRLYKAAVESGASQINAQLVAKQAGEILDKYYDEAIASVPFMERAKAKHFIENRLIYGNPPFRMRAPVQEALDRGISEPGLQALDTSRLIVADGPIDKEHGQTLLELAHDCICEVAGRRRDQGGVFSTFLQRLTRAKWYFQVVFYGVLLGACVVTGLAAIFALHQARVAESRAAELASTLAAERLESAEEAVDIAGRWLVKAKESISLDPGTSQQVLRDALQKLSQASTDLDNVAPGLVAHHEPKLRTVREQLASLKGSLAQVSHDAEEAVKRATPIIASVQISGSIPESRSSITLAHGGPVYCADYSPVRNDGAQTLVTAGADKMVRLWSADGAAIADRTSSTQAVNMVRYSPDGTQVASASDGSTVRLYDLVRKSTVAFEKQADSITWIDFMKGSYDRNFPVASGYLASASEDRSIYVYETRSGKVVYSTGQRLPAAATSVQFAPQGGELLVTACDDYMVRLHKWRPPRPGATVPPPKLLMGLTAPARRASFSYNDEWIVACSAGGEAAVWHADLPGDKPFRLLRVAPEGTRLPIFHAVFSTLWSENKELPIAICAGDGVVRLWDFIRGATREFKGHTAAVRYAAWSQNGRWLATGDSNGDVIIWSVAGLEAAAKVRLAGHTKIIRYLAFSPDDQQLASCSDDGTVRLWSADLWRGRGTSSPSNVRPPSQATPVARSGNPY